MTIKERNAADQDFITHEALRIKNEKKQKNDNRLDEDQNKKKGKKE